MPIKWCNIRLPHELHARLMRLAEEFDQATVSDRPPQCQPRVPAEFADRGVIPHWWIIQRAINEFEAHRRRSRSKRKKSIGSGT